MMVVSGDYASRTEAGYARLTIFPKTFNVMKFEFN